MKNIQVLPTDKPSRLAGSEYITNVQGIDKRVFKFKLWNKFIDNKDLKAVGYIPHNIYITSDEEIKEGDLKNGEYYLYFNKVKQFKKIDNLIRAWKDYKKIILTTDQDLIKDGVQAIDDKFLEWFVKNPSCEWVEVIPLRKSSGWYDEKEVWHWDFLAYKIIIPKEEREQDYSKIREGLKKSIKGKEHFIQHFKNGGSVEDFKPLEESKQETLEETAKTYCKNKYGEGYYPDVEKGIEFGAKWQQERSYSEEDLRNAYRWGTTVNHGTKEHFNEWFEQFKKK